MLRSTSLLLFCFFVATHLSLGADERPDPRIAFDTAFPDGTAAKNYAGELILVDHVNRIGILRLDRDGTINNYHWDLPHQFQMLPYGSLMYRGAPANLEDIPLGTHLHGEFYLGPEGEFELKVPDTGYAAGKMANPDLRSTVSPYSRVLSLADDFSFSAAKGEGWRIIEFAKDRTTITVERVLLADGSLARSGVAEQGVKSRMVLRLDRGARIWKGRQFASLEELAIGQVVQFNLGWVTLLGSEKQDGLCRDIWIDEESRKVATEQQRQTYLASMKRLGIPATILKTEHVPGEGAKGYITLAVHAGVDPELMTAFGPKSVVLTWPAEPSLRVYDAKNDIKPCSDLRITAVPKPPAGHSGVEIRMRCSEMIEGFRAGRTIRLALQEWAPPERPREELLWPNDTRKFSIGPKPVSDRDAEHVK